MSFDNKLLISEAVALLQVLGKYPKVLWKHDSNEWYILAGLHHWARLVK